MASRIKDVRHTLRYSHSQPIRRQKAGKLDPWLWMSLSNPSRAISFSFDGPIKASALSTNQCAKERFLAVVAKEGNTVTATACIDCNYHHSYKMFETVQISVIRNKFGKFCDIHEWSCFTEELVTNREIFVSIFFSQNTNRYCKRHYQASKEQLCGMHLHYVVPNCGVGFQVVCVI